MPQAKICNTRREADLEKAWRTLDEEGSVYWRKVFLIWELNNVLANRNQFTLLVLVSFILISLEQNLRILRKNKHVIILNFFSSGLESATSSPQPFWHQGPVSWKTIFPWTGGLGLVWGWFKHIIFIMHFISIIITSAPPQIICH